MKKLSSHIRRYFRGKFRADLTAGLTVAMVVIPQSMAYAAIAGVNPVYGLFTAIIPPIISAIFGSFPYLITGPTNPTALVTASVLVGFADRPDYLQFVFALAIIAGLLNFIFGLFKLGSIIKYISNSVLVGFLTAAGVLIILGQSSNLLGIEISRTGGLPEILTNLYKNINLSHGLTIIISVISVGLMIVVRKLNRKLPAALITIVIVSLLVFATGWADQGVRLVQDYGLPDQIGLQFHLPTISLSEFASLGISGVAVALFGLMETMSIAKAMSQMTGDRLDPSREMIGQGLASLAGGFFQCIPSAGSPSRTVINVVNGAKTRFSAIISGLGVLGFMLLFSDLINYIPLSGLSAVVMVSAAGLVNIKLIKLTWQSRIQSRVVMVITFVSTLVLPLEYAIYLGVLLTILIYLSESSRVNLSYLIMDKEGHFLEMPMERIEKREPQIVIVNVEGDLYFAAVEDLQNQLENILDTGIRVLILRFRRTHLLASTGVMALDRLVKSAYAKGVHILFCGIHPEVRQPLESAGVTEMLGDEKIFFARSELFQSTQMAMKKAKQIVNQQNNP